MGILLVKMNSLNSNIDAEIDRLKTIYNSNLDNYHTYTLQEWEINSKSREQMLAIYYCHLATVERQNIYSSLIDDKYLKLIDRLLFIIEIKYSNINDFIDYINECNASVLDII